MNKRILTEIQRIDYIKKVLMVIRDPINMGKHYINRIGALVMYSSNVKEVERFQDQNIKMKYSPNTKRLIVFLVPGWDGVNGGVMSICSLAKVTRMHQKIHKSEVILATLPKHKIFKKYSKFENPFDIYRFDQLLTHFKDLQELTIHIPENFVVDFNKSIDSDGTEFIKKVKKVTINIMNQNIWLMPGREHVDELREISDELTITVAHQKYCTTELRNKYNATVHLFSTSNLTNYNYKSYDEKEHLLLTSIDNHPLKEDILDSIRQKFPSIKFKQIENMEYEEYKEWISIARWMITFGEGLDGYFCESIRSGAISFAVYNPDFFSERFENLETVYESYEEMLHKIAGDIEFYNDSTSFKQMNDKMIAIDKAEYNDETYIKNVENYYRRKYDLPVDGVKKQKDRRKKLLKKAPLVSVVMATYNGEKYLSKQLQSIANLTYPNIELIISDDYSSDLTPTIIKNFSKVYPLTFVQNDGKKGVNGNFENALKLAKGEYIALCDQDDIWLPNKVEILLEKIDDYDIIHSNVDVIDEADNPHPNEIMQYEYTQDFSSKTKLVDYITSGWVLGCTSLIKRELIKEAMPFPDDIFFHDWWLSIIALKNGNGIKYLHEPTIKYRQHSSNSAQKAFATPKWLVKKIKFNELIQAEFENTLSRVEKLAIRNNTHYCASKYFLLADSNHEYSELEKFLEENKDLFNRHFLRKFVNIVASDVISEHVEHRSGQSAITPSLRGTMQWKVNYPSSLFDRLLSRFYRMFIKPIIVTPYRVVKQKIN